MSGVEKIKDRIINEAKSEAENILNNAKTGAMEIIKSANEKTMENNKLMIGQASDEANDIKERAKGSFRLESIKEKLRVKQQIIDEAFEKSLNNLCQKEDKEYEDIIINMVSNFSETGTEEVVLNEKDSNRISKDFIDRINNKISSMGKLGNVKLSNMKANIKGGVILKNGDIEFNASFEALLRQKKEELEPLVYEVLFG